MQISRTFRLGGHVNQLLRSSVWCGFIAKAKTICEVFHGKVSSFRAILPFSLSLHMVKTKPEDVPVTGPCEPEDGVSALLERLCEPCTNSGNCPSSSST